MLPSHSRVVIIGGGAVGVSILYHLAKAGWTECLLLERNELTAGSTWHAAGNVPTFSTDWGIMSIQRYSTDLYRRLADEVDYPINYHVSGSLRLAHSKERRQEFLHVAGMAARQGLSYDLLSPDKALALNPFLELHDLDCVLWDPVDGDIDPAQLTQAFAKGARNLGAKIERFCPVDGIGRDGDEWLLETPKGDIRAEIIVNAAGYQAQRVGEMFRPFGGRRVPMTVMSHQYLLFEEVDEVRKRTTETGGKLPIVRDVDTSYYLRQEKGGFNLGPYERNCRAHWTGGDDPMPQDFSFELFPDDLDRLEFYLEDAIARVPLMGTAGLSKVINGPIPYTPDGLPLIGPMPGVPNAFEACVFSFGIAQAGGAGKAMAEWIIEGAPEWELWSCDPRRFTDYADDAYTLAKAKQVYGHEYGMHFPRYRWPAAPDKRLSALDGRMRAAGGRMAPFNGWERPRWYAAPGDDLSDAALERWGRDGPDAPRIATECAAVSEHCGMVALPGFTRLRLTGEGARDHLDRLTASPLPAQDRVGLLYFVDDNGRLITEMSGVVHSSTDISLITAAAAQWHDRDVLLDGAPSTVEVHDESDLRECLLVTGPRARERLAPLAEADLFLPWLSAQPARVAGVEVELLRVSFAGELGWEVHAAPDNMPIIWDALTAAGVVPVGMVALDMLRLEKGYPAWKQEIARDVTLLEAGLERFVRFDKRAAFRGRDALLSERQRGPARRRVTLRVDANGIDAAPNSPIWMGDRIVGGTTSGGWGYRVGSSIALATLDADAAKPGGAVEVEVFGERRSAEIADGLALWDPKNLRLKA